MRLFYILHYGCFVCDRCTESCVCRRINHDNVFVYYAGLQLCATLPGNNSAFKPRKRLKSWQRGRHSAQSWVSAYSSLDFCLYFERSVSFSHLNLTENVRNQRNYSTCEGILKQSWHNPGRPQEQGLAVRAVWRTTSSDLWYCRWPCVCVCVCLWAVETLSWLQPLLFLFIPGSCQCQLFGRGFLLRWTHGNLFLFFPPYIYFTVGFSFNLSLYTWEGTSSRDGAAALICFCSMVMLSCDITKEQAMSL